MFSAMPTFANDIVIISVKTGILFFIAKIKRMIILLKCEEEACSDIAGDSLNQV